MGARRGATRLCGVLPVDKPAGMTSHDVVAVVRRATGEGRVGHAGTLDPAATGLLIVLVGAYTRLEPYLSSAVKTYEARIAFGAETDTDDAEGTPVREAVVPPDLFDTATATRILDGLLGESMQQPPAYSAIKVGGQVAHRVARAGGELAVAARAVRVDEARLLGTDAAAGIWDVAFTVSKGTYIRALARDAGRAAGSAAHLAGLRRTRSGGFPVTEAVALDAVRDAGPEAVASLFVDPLALLGIPAADVDSAEDVLAGRRLPAALAPSTDEGSRVALRHAGSLIAVYRREAGTLVPEAVFPGACA